MKVLGSFVDCVYESHLYKEDIGDIRTKLISRLSDKRICEMASVLIIDTKYDAYVVKIRRPELNNSGCVDIEKTHKKIYETDFIEISNRDYKGLDWREAAKKTDKLMKPGSFVIFKTDIDVDSLIKWKIAFNSRTEDDKNGKTVHCRNDNNGWWQRFVSWTNSWWISFWIA